VLTLANKLLIQPGAQSILKALTSRDFFRGVFSSLSPVSSIKLRPSLLMYGAGIWPGIRGVLGVMNRLVWYGMAWCGEGFGGHSGG